MDKIVDKSNRDNVAKDGLGDIEVIVHWLNLISIAWFFLAFKVGTPKYKYLSW
jgi:hypothetical protein